MVDAPADVIVHEIVDSALLGEGMLPALRGIFGDSQLVDPKLFMECEAIAPKPLKKAGFEKLEF